MAQCPPIDIITSCLPSSQAIFKELRVPFIGRGTIKKIIGYEVEPLLPFPLQEALEQAGISMEQNVSAVQKIISTPREDNYLENVATYQLTRITMKQLTEFLTIINQNKRLFIKELEISKSKKFPHTIDVDIKIAAMMPKETT